ncbi:hypothetical protein AB1N83_009009 [Pleurotus pulmonarius]
MASSNLLFANFNQNYLCVSVATRKGYSITMAHAVYPRKLQIVNTKRQTMICELLSPRQFSPSNEPKGPRCRAGDGDIHIRHRQHAVAARNRDDRESGSNLCSFTKLGGIILGLSITKRIGQGHDDGAYRQRRSCISSGGGRGRGGYIYNIAFNPVGSLIAVISAHGGERSKTTSAATSVSETGSIESRDGPVEGATRPTSTRERRAASHDLPSMVEIRAPRLAHTGGLLLFSAQHHRSPGLLPQQPIRTT